MTASRASLWFEFSRPFTLVAPALGFASGAVTAAGAAPREMMSADLIIYPVIGLTMATAMAPSALPHPDRMSSTAVAVPLTR